jgi:phenylpropionate dioxygenase-like ring-hydroxylating dioxygenase large terminal subunit
MQQIPVVRIPPEVREDFVPADAYILPEYVEIEEQMLWPKTWLIAAREEELPQPGDYHVFDIGRESILIVRQEDRSLKAFYNVCQHRGRRLKDNMCGRTGKLIRCNFHGWRYHIDGSLESVLNPQDWDGCETFDTKELNLKSVKLDTWAGWIWVSMNPDIEPLREYLGEVGLALDQYEFENFRFAWYKTVIVPCNWKVIVDAFNEAYHAPATHPWVFKYGAPMSYTKAFGIHGAFWQRTLLDPHIGENVITPAPMRPLRERLEYFVTKMTERGQTMVSKYTLAAVERIKTLPEDTDDIALLTQYGAFMREEMAKDGLEWQAGLTPEYLATAATDYHIFPNTTVVPGADSTLWHRMRPNGNDPASAIWDIWSIERFPEGKAPPLKYESFANPAEFKGQNPFLEEDFSNMEATHKGMWSRGFVGGRTNPVQEVSVSNFHKTLYAYYSGQQSTSSQQPKP